MLYVFLMMFLVYVVSTLGYSLTYYGSMRRKLETTPSFLEFWWIFQCFTTTCYNILLLRNLTHLEKTHRQSFSNWVKKSSWITIMCSVTKYLQQILIGIFPIILLIKSAKSEDDKDAKYFAAINSIIICFELMWTLGKLPNVGLYFFMLQRVFFSIVRFFATYFWHFIGYAIAFHIILNGEGENNKDFNSLFDSIVKVRNTEIFSIYN